MKQVRLGSQGLTTSAIGLGCMPLSGLYGEIDESDAVATIHAAVDAGITLFDTADVYGLGDNERLVGRAVQARRDEVILATKAAFVRDANGKPVGPNGIDCRPEHLYAACDASLRRLGVETIDLFQLHRVDPRVPIEESVGAIAELVRLGKVRYIGLSEASVADIARAHREHPVSTVQSEYSLVERTVEATVLQVCRDLDIGFLPYAPLCRGLLTGSLPSADSSDTRNGARFPRLATENREANEALARTVQGVAAEIGCSAGQVALAWLIRIPSVVPIPGTKRAAYVRDNAGAASVELSEAQVRLLDALAGRVAGDRYGGDATAADWDSPPRDQRSVARPRVVVTAHTGDGRSVVARNALLRSLRGPDRLGYTTQPIWAADSLPVLPSSEPVTGEPEDLLGIAPGGVRFVQVVVMPWRTVAGIALEAGDRHNVMTFDRPAAETLEVVEHEQPGMHFTRSVDLVTVLEGDVVLVLEGEEVVLTAGDAVVQQGTTHAWRNDTSRPVRMAVCRLAADHRG